MGNGTGMGKAPPTENLRLRPCFNLCGGGDGDGDGFGGGDGDGKAISGPATLRSAPLPSLLVRHGSTHPLSSRVGVHKSHRMGAFVKKHSISIFKKKTLYLLLG